MPNRTLTSNTTWLLVLGLLGCTLVASRADATVLRQMDLPTLTAESDLVVVGHVQEQWSLWIDELQTIRTFTRVRIQDVVVGGTVETVGADIIVEQAGGRIDTRMIQVAGNAELEVGERALLFLLRGDNYYIHGMEQGKYRIDTDDDGVDRIERPSTVPLVAPTGDGELALVEHVAVELNGASLSDVVAQIRALGGE